MFKKRKIKLGILFSHNENWIGGTYYLLNLISSFNNLEDKKKPNVIIISENKSDFEVAKKTNYPYLSFLDYNFEEPYNLLKRIIFRVFPAYSKRKFKKSYINKNVDVVFPFNDLEKLKDVRKKIYWYADFQEYYYPDFFSKEEIYAREKLQNDFAYKKTNLILSSNSALSDFKKIHPDFKCNPHVVQFAVTHPEYVYIDITEIKKKYNIKGDYFISPNQFWQHKNHIIILQAVKYLKEKGKKIKVVFTGKEYDYRNPFYTNDLKKYVVENNLSDSIIFLGFIDRAEQLQLMNNALAVIQPSLFEGWSTVVEDAKAMNQFVIASDIEVHKEQLTENVVFFERKNYTQLAEIIENIKNHENIIIKNDYLMNVQKFANDFISIIS